jgi:opacity protein-like surface antigen
MLRRLFAATMAAGLLLLIGAPAYAAPPVTTVTHEKDLVETFVDVVPTCEGGGPLYTITTTSNLVSKESVFDDGRVHATFTQTGTFVAEPLEDPSLPSFTGKFTSWGGFNQNGKTVNGTFTFTVHGTGSDGSTFRFHTTEHFNARPDGTVNEFFRCHD